MTTPTAAPAGLLDQAWDLDPSVAVRPEPFGALLYHFGTRRLSFVRSREVVQVLHALAAAPTAADACAAVGVPRERLEVTVRSLTTLAASGLIQQRG